MNAPRETDGCPRTAAVLALCLDGDIGEETGFDFVSGESTTDHLADCLACATALRRARRLDALLAESAGRDATADGDGQALLDRLVGRELARRKSAETPPPGRAPAWANARALLPAGLLLSVSLLLVSGWHRFTTRPEDRPSPPPPTATNRANVSPVEPAPEASPRQIGPLETGPLETGPSFAEVAPRRRTIALADDTVCRAPRTARPERNPSAALARFADPGRSAEERLAALRIVLGRARGSRADSTRTALTRLLAGGHDEDLQTEALRLAAARPDYVSFLRSAVASPSSERFADADLDRLASLVVAARLGIATLDDAVLRAVAEDPERAEALASAIRRPGLQRHGGRLLLEAWSILAARHGTTDGRMAGTLFAGQPAEVFTELRIVLARSRSAPERTRCLLALAHDTHRETTALLMRWALSGCRREAYAAAFALSQMPHAWLGESAALAASDRSAFVLRAGLARARLPAAESWTVPLHLGPDERRELTEAPFDRFPRIAEWFRGGTRHRRPPGHLASED